MARISTYGVDAKPELNDKVIGTDTAPGADLRTKNYSLGEIIDLFNQSNALGVADQSIFLYQSDISQGRDAGTISFVAGGGVGTPFSTITQVLISKTAPGNKSVAQYLPLFIGKDIILAESGNINNFGTYKVASITTDIAEPNFFLVTLENYTSNGVISLDGYYIFSEFVDANSAGDKNFVFNQAVASTTWTVQHNLNKFPSVTSVNINNIEMYGEVVFTDVNNLTINFTSASSGKAYIN
tara:strand:+ start:1020 stop:1739 length:720 start_codon:yes stop_codon:yes gene_type:complete